MLPQAVTGLSVSSCATEHKSIVLGQGLCCLESVLRIRPAMKWLAKLLHPKAPSHEVRRHARAYYLALALGLVVAALVAGMIYWIYNADRFRR